jgi:hypothetical protein
MPQARKLAEIPARFRYRNRFALDLMPCWTYIVPYGCRNRKFVLYLPR